MRRTVAVLALVASACARPASHDDRERMRAARQAHDALSAQLDPLVDADPRVQQALAVRGELVMGVHRDLVTQLVQAVGRRYLHEVALDLPLMHTVETSGDIRVPTRLGTIHAGTWTAKITVRRVQGTLVTDAPQVTLGTGDDVAFAAKMGVRDGRGRASVDFRWDGRSIGGLVCRDFQLQRELAGTLKPLQVPVSGTFHLETRGDEVVAQPRFPHRRFHIRPDLTSASWAVVADALAEQDRVLRCGLALDPEDVRRKLERLLAKGFDVTLPDSLFRPVALPARVGHATEVQGRKVEVDAGARDLRVTPEGVWLGVGVAPR